MGLAHARVTAEIELIETALPSSGQRQCSLTRERIARSDNEALETEGQFGLKGCALVIEL
jgi:hypothetical protein